MSGLTEIVAQALVKSGFKADERDALDLLDALRDPPAHVIEAGAKAMHDALPYFNPWDEVDDVTRAIFRKSWLTAWRAALSAGGER